MANKSLPAESKQLIEELLAAIEAEKAGTLDSLARDISALERRVAALEEDRNRRDELDAAAATVLASHGTTTMT
jgi:polyhydroxyalkanoate synthesis regulator phasin